MEAPLGQPLCTRLVSAYVQHTKTSVEIAIYAPFSDPQHDNWWCVIRLVGIGPYLDPAREEWRLGGVDSFGALENALEHIPHLLESTGIEWTWGKDPDPKPDPDGIYWHGFSRAIAPSKPVTFQRKMKALIDSETETAIKSGDMRRFAQSDLSNPSVETA